MSNTSEILLVMVHVWHDMPELENIRWQDFTQLIVDKANAIPWTKVWQFDFIDQNVFRSLEQNKLSANNQIMDQGKVPHPDIVYGNNDWISTSDSQTAQIIKSIDPKIVIFGGLHKDLCVTGVKLAVEDDQREYFVSDRLAYTWKETAAAIYKDWGQ
jgi:hypothetical protein